MKKFLLSTFVIALIAVVLAAPYWFGVEAERIFNHQMSALDENNKVSVLNSDFTRGWFSSQAKTSISLQDRGATLIARHDIEHGPFPIRDFFGHLLALRPLQALIRSELYLPGISSSDDDVEIGLSTTWINLDGTTNTAVNIPAAETLVPDGGHFRWQDVQARIDFNPATAAFEGDVEIEGLLWDREQMQIELGPTTLAFLSFPGSTGLALGNSTLNAKSVKFHSSGGAQSLATSELFIESTAVEDGARIAYGIDGSLGPSLLKAMDVSAGEWRLGARDLDLSTLTDLNAGPPGEALPINKLIDLVSTQGASIESGLELQTSSGPIVAEAILRMDAGKISNPLLLFGALHGQAAMDVPASVVELAAATAIQRTQPGSQSGEPAVLAPNSTDHEVEPEQIQRKIDGWIADNLLIREQNRYRFEASINGGSITVNGKPFNIFSLIR